MIPIFKTVAVRLLKPAVGPARWSRLKGWQASLTSPRQAGFGADLATMSLTELAIHFGTDKWGAHRYTPHYERHLRHLRKREFTLLEIGIGGYARDGEGGASLRMWKHFFTSAQIIGLDIQDKSFVNEERIQAYRGSQTNKALLKTIRASAPGLRVVIDDGSHRPEHIRKTFDILFPMLPKGGIYAIEDTQTSYWPRYGGSSDLDEPSTTMGLVKSLIDGLNWEEFHDEGYRPTYTERHVSAVHCYHNLVFVVKGANHEGTTGLHH